MKTIFIATKERLLGEALSSYCASIHLKVIGQSTDGRRTLDIITREKPNFAIIDAELPEINGFEIISKIKRSDFVIQSILYLRSQRPDYLRRALSLKVNSLLFSDDGIKELSNCFIKEHLLPKPIEYNNTKVIEKLEYRPDPLHSLTPTQLRILALVSTHITMSEIAQKLFISPHTVNNHLANIRKKLDMQGRGVILKYALANKNRLIEVDGKVCIVDDYSPHFVG